MKRLARPRTLLFALAALATAVPAIAGINAWTGGGPPGGFVIALVSDPGDAWTVYAGTSRGVFRSSDGGAHWVARNGGLPDPLYLTALAAASPGVLYAAAYGGTYKSTDGGGTWTRLGLVMSFPFPTAPNALGVDPSRPDTVYAGFCGGGIWKTVDGGMTWIQTSAPASNTRVIAVDPSRPETVYAADQGGCNVFPSGKHVERAFFYGDGGVWKSVDGGEHWVAKNHGLANTRILSLALNPSNPSVLFAAVDGSVARSDDGGETWVDSGNGLTAASVAAFAFGAPGGNLLYAATSDGLYTSVDGGVSWTCGNRGLGGRSIQALLPAVSGVLLAGTMGGGIYRTSDEGGSWESANGDFSGALVATVAVERAAPKVVYAGTLGGGIFRSEDGGGSWLFASHGLTDSSISSLAVHPRLGGTLYAATGRGIFKSTDGARNWAALPVDAPTRLIRIDSTSARRLYAVTERDLQRSTDGGLTWTAEETGLPEPRVIYPLTALEIDPRSPSTLYAGIQNTNDVYRSLDFGATWSPLGAEFGFPVFSIAIDPQDSGTLYVGTDRIFVSRDAGRTWSALAGPLARITSLTVSPSNSSVLYATADAYASVGVFGVFESLDRGATWTRLADGLAPTQAFALAIAEPEGTVYAGTDAGVFALTAALEPVRARGLRPPPRRVAPR